MTATLTGSITESFRSRFDALSPQDLIRWADEEFTDSLVMSTSFGIQSAVMLHMAKQIRPTMPVIWVDTGYLPGETYEYAQTLASLLDLNLVVARAEMSPAEMEARHGRLWESDDLADLDLYDRIRKVEPMQRTLQSLGAHGWISGLRAEQTAFREQLPRVQRRGQQYRIYPILSWTNKDVYYYMEQHGLPQHPLFAQGYTTVGDAHSSRPPTAGDEDDRATRFRGLKQECGLHLS